jgi:TATA-binding protein-associated factor Taf7
MHFQKRAYKLIRCYNFFYFILLIDQRNAKFRVGRKKYDAYVVDLPCIVESHKTLDKTTYYKSADIGQVPLQTSI